jgi:TATA-binding protein-associated factor
MNTNQLLDLFIYTPQDPTATSNISIVNELGEIDQNNGQLKAILNSLTQLWNENQYQEEYNLNSFIKHLQ